MRELRGYKEALFIIVGIGVAAGGILRHSRWMYIGNEIVEGLIHGRGSHAYYKLGENPDFPATWTRREHYLLFREEYLS